VSLLLAALVLAFGGGDLERTAGTPPPCYGAAALDPQEPCENPDLRFSVEPTPQEALRAPNAPCTRSTRKGLVHPCVFGVPAEQAQRTIALIGDSHASHWRGAVAAVAEAKRWQGLSITACPLSKAVKRLDPPDRERCVRWKNAVFRWFRRHPEVHTVFVSQIVSPKGVVVRAGQDVRAAEIAGYARAWRSLPRSVKRVVVLRDTPHVSESTGRCIEQAVAAHRRPGPACAVPRATALKRDTAVVAAERLASRRVRVIDMTRFFCDARLCYPVIGGVLVFKDSTHVTALYSTTLGPYLLRRVSALGL
jgi:hypothetical protein